MLVIIALLVGQAVCELALPQYTSNIVDVGIQNGGIETEAPEVMRQETMELLLRFLNEQEKQTVQGAYVLYGAGEAEDSILEDYPAAETEGVYVLEGENREEIEEILVPAETVLMTLRSEGEEAQAMRETVLAQMGLSADTDLNQALPMLPDEALQAIKEGIIEEMGNMGDTMLSSMGVAFVKDEYAQMGMDMEGTQMGYLGSVGLQMLGLALRGMLFTIAVAFLSLRMAARTSRDLRSRIFHKVVSFSNEEMSQFSTSSLITRCTNDVQQVQMVLMLMFRMVIYAPILGIGGILKVLQTRTHMEWIIVVAVVGGYLSIQGTIRVGDIQSFIQYVRQFTQPIGQMAQVSNMLQSAVAAAERVFEFLEEPEEEQKAKEHASMVDPATGERRNVTITDLSGNVEFDHVQFGYRPDKIIIHDFSVKVKNGQKIAIVGPTGAGKTTIVKLLMRFYDLNGGEIRIDGYPLSAFDRSELREAFGMVLQDTWLFNGTIMENIRYGRLDATDEEVIEAAKAAKVHHFIQTLPGGYQMVLNEEVTNISQGQKQLLTIARAILANNKILILDEATSSVDTRTEIQIQEAMDHLMEGRTSFIIAHRLSTIRNADWILFLKDGDVVEQGTHDELLAKGGAYAELYNSQFQETA